MLRFNMKVRGILQGCLLSVMVFSHLSTLSEATINRGEDDAEVEAERLLAVAKRAARCDRKAKYRSIDGSCNNLKHRAWGTPLQTLRRHLTPAYDDRKCQPRLFRKGKVPLPSPRNISTTCFPAETKKLEMKTFSQMIMQWGQFVDHDISITPQTKLSDGVKTCTGMRRDGTHPNYATCGPSFPIQIPPGDRYFHTCMEFKRSVNITDSDGVRQQINKITAFIDGSMVYGSTAQELKKLRLFEKGFMIEVDSFMPQRDSKGCVIKAPATGCFLAGDARTNAFSGLTAMHTIFVREHNRIAANLAKINPEWKDETLFQETRRIIIASIQHITYKEWLPKILGEKVMTEMGLLRPYQYMRSQNPGVFNSFPTAAFRFGHSQIRDIYHAYKNKFMPVQNLYFRPHTLLVGGGKGIEAIVQGLLDTTLPRVDNHMTRGITDFLFQNVSAPGVSFDLVSLNIQRGRDHGLPPYTEFVNFCKEKLKGNGYKRRIPDCLRKVYGSPADIDLFAGGLFEEPVPEGQVGPTFACIIALQFKNLRNGDRFFYETRNKNVRFTPVQQEEIKKISLSRIICDNTNIERIQKNAFLISTNGRGKKCNKLPKVDLRKWKNA